MPFEDDTSLELRQTWQKGFFLTNESRSLSGNLLGEFSVPAFT